MGYPGLGGIERALNMIVTDSIVEYGKIMRWDLEQARHLRFHKVAPDLDK